MYDTIKELHIEIEQRIQQVTSNRYGALPHQFYDMMLNRTAVQYVQLKSNRKTNYKAEGLEDSKKRVDDIQSLKRETIWLSVKKDEEPNRAFVILPGDYLKLVSSTSRLKYGKPRFHKELHKTYSRDDIKNLYYYVIDLKQVYDAFLNVGKEYDSLEFYIRIGKQLTDKEVFKFDVKPVYDIVYKDGNRQYDLFEIAPLICRGLRDALSNKIDFVKSHLSKDYQIYWERLDERFYPHSIIITSSSKVEIDFKLLSYDFVSSYNTTFDEFDLNDVDKEYIYSGNDLVATENVRATLNNYYGNKNRHLNPISELINDRLYVYYGEDFCIDAVKVSYIKEPSPFSYDLDLMSDLTITPEFMDLVVSNILIVLKDDSANTVRQQFNLE